MLRLPIERRLTQGFMPVADEAAEYGDFELAGRLVGAQTVHRWFIGEARRREVEIRRYHRRMGKLPT